MRRYWAMALHAKAGGYVASIIGVALVIATLAPFHGQVRTAAALALLLVVLFIATAWGSSPAFAAAVLAALGYNFFFLPPVRTFTIVEPQNWIGFFAFAITALTAGQLSARARRRAEDAEQARAESERLYRELQLAFERASEAEALRRSEQLKTALLDAVTHDLRSPLTSIKGSATALLDAHNNQQNSVQFGAEAYRELLEIINEEADRLNRFVENLVDMARIEAGDLALRRSWGVVDDIISLALERAGRLAAQHQVVVHVEENLPPVNVDPRALAQVIFSLLENATKYSPQRTAIHIRAFRLSDAELCFSVEDQGPGISPELRERVFDRFFRIHQPESKGKRATGLGMGLSIARGIAEAHGGRIWVEDCRQGSKILFTVPVGENRTGAPAGSGAPPAKGKLSRLGAPR